MQAAAVAVTGIFLQVFKNMRALQGEAGVELGSPLLADAGAAAPGGAGGQIPLFDQQNVGNAPFGQLKGGGAADDAAADNNDFVFAFHQAVPPFPPFPAAPLWPSFQASARTPMETGLVGGRKVGIRTSSMGMW